MNFKYSLISFYSNWMIDSYCPLPESEPPVLPESVPPPVLPESPPVLPESPPVLPELPLLLPESVPPPVLPELLKSENGLILVTGATGSGKSTTLAAMVGYLNQHADAHILTLEDPVEYLYASQRCLIQQREIGLHCMTFASGLRAALREDPDVILLGELRDSETIRLALTAAETGHLVLEYLSDKEKNF